MPTLKYCLNKENFNSLQSLIGSQFWYFCYSSDNMLVINYVNLKSLNLLYSNQGILTFKTDNLITKLKINFPIISEQELTYDLCSIRISTDSDVFHPLYYSKKICSNDRVISFSDGPIVKMIEVYSIVNKDYIYEYYEQHSRKEINKIIDIDIDLFLVFYLSNNSTLLLANNSSTGGCSLSIASIDDFESHLKLLKSQHYEEFNLTLKKSIL